MELSIPILCMRRETRRPLLMGNVDEFTAQSRLYASDGLSREVMSAMELLYHNSSCSMISIICAAVTTLGVCGKCFMLPVTKKESSSLRATS